jgi:hypothetical protein
VTSGLDPKYPLCSFGDDTYGAIDRQREDKETTPPLRIYVVNFIQNALRIVSRDHAVSSTACHNVAGFPADHDFEQQRNDYWGHQSNVKS